MLKTACYAALVATATAFSAGPALPLRQTQVCRWISRCRGTSGVKISSSCLFSVLDEVLVGAATSAVSRYRDVERRR